MEVVASLSQGRTAAAQCGLFTHKSVPVIFEPPCTFQYRERYIKEMSQRTIKTDNKIRVLSIKRMPFTQNLSLTVTQQLHANA